MNQTFSFSFFPHLKHPSFLFFQPPSQTWRSRGDKSELEGVPDWILKDAVELALQAREGLERKHRI